MANNSMMNVIRCELKDYIVWKWRPQYSNSSDGHNQRANNIRWGSSLRIKDGEMAVFVYRNAYADSHDIQEFIMGPYDGILETANLPLISEIIAKAYGKGEGGPFQAEVYFINLQGNNQIMFFIPSFDVFDSRFSDLAIPISVRGSILFNLTDYKQFIKLNSLRNFNNMDFKSQIRSALNKYIRHVIINITDKNEMSVMRLESAIMEISEEAQRYMAKRFSNDFGVNLKALDIEAITLNKDSEGYKQLKQLTVDIAAGTTVAKAKINIQNLDDAQKWNSENVRATMAIQRGEMKRAQSLQTETQYLAAHALNQQTEVGKEFAAAMGKSGGMNSGDGNMNPAGMMTSMMMGGVLGQQMAGMMNQMGNVANQNYQQYMQQPPVFTQYSFYVVVNGQQSGPYATQELNSLIVKGTLTPNSYVWKIGMKNWDLAKNTEINKLFSTVSSTQEHTPPPIPPMFNSNKEE